MDDETWTNEELKPYNDFVDGLVKRGSMGSSDTSRSVKPNGFPTLPLDYADSKRNAKYNKVLGELTPEQLEVVKGIVHESYEGGIHDVLAYLSENINLNNLRLSFSGVELPVKPYFRDLHYDWLSRLEGEEWPADEDGE